MAFWTDIYKANNSLAQGHINVLGNEDKNQ